MLVEFLVIFAFLNLIYNKCVPNQRLFNVVSKKRGYLIILKNILFLEHFLEFSGIFNVNAFAR